MPAWRGFGGCAGSSIRREDQSHGGFLSSLTSLNNQLKISLGHYIIEISRSARRHSCLPTLDLVAGGVYVIAILAMVAVV
jgi:hypothetical protein